MARKTNYIFEDETGNEHTYEVFYDIIRPYAGGWDEEPETDAVEIQKVLEDGFELTDLNDQLLEDIKYFCLEEYDDDQWEYEQD